MRFFLLVTILFVQLYSNTQLNTQDNIDQNTQYQTLLKKYFTSNLALQINVHKNILRPYYKYTKYNLIWFDNDTIHPILVQIIDTIQNDKILSPVAKNEFNFEQIETFLENKLHNTTLSVEDTIRLDLLLTNLFDRYVNAVARGSIDWKLFEEKLEILFEEKEITANWARNRAYFNKVELLEQLLLHKDISLIDKYVGITFPHGQKLLEAIDELQLIVNDGDYIEVPLSKTLRPQQYNPIVPILRKRLLQSKDYSISLYDQIMTNFDFQTLQDHSQPFLYDEDLVNAVKSFQKNHGLEVDGIVGKETIKYLNIKAKEKINIIRVNLERMRWLKRNLGEKYLLVNIPDYSLKYINDNELKLQLPVIVGTIENPTPIFSHNLSSVVLNPYWRVPESIVQKEIIPKMIEDPQYLAQNNINIHENWDHESQTFDPALVDWSYYLPTPEQKENNQYPEVPFKFIQVPGDNNPLGKMKFMFRNQFSVYLHDTSTKNLFSKTKRAFSHGCIRVDKPQQLLKTIAEVDKRLHYDEAIDILKQIEQKEIDLNDSIPIHIVYLTSWVDEDGTLQFREDIYNYDSMQIEIMY